MVGGGSQRLLCLNPTTVMVVLLLGLWLLLGCDNKTCFMQGRKIEHRSLLTWDLYIRKKKNTFLTMGIVFYNSLTVSVSQLVVQ